MKTETASLKKYMARRASWVDRELKRLIRRDGRTAIPFLAPMPAGIRKAMEYSLMAGGKRLRPVLVMAAAEACGLAGRRVLRAACGPRVAGYRLDAETIPADQAQVAEQLLTAERHAALREAVAYLPPRCQELIALLIQDPPVPYAMISARLGIPVGSIGPNRSRCLDRLRRHPAIAALMNA